MQRDGGEQRRRENAEILRRMRAGDKLCHTDLSAYRWAPRQIIKKDKAEMARLYGAKEESNGDA